VECTSTRSYGEGEQTKQRVGFRLEKRIWQGVDLVQLLHAWGFVRVLIVYVRSSRRALCMLDSRSNDLVAKPSRSNSIIVVYYGGTSIHSCHYLHLDRSFRNLHHSLSPCCSCSCSCSLRRGGRTTTMGQMEAIVHNSPALDSLKHQQLRSLCARHGLKSTGKVGKLFVVDCDIVYG
jgi:hypothetical protein